MVHTEDGKTDDPFDDLLTAVENAIDGISSNSSSSSSSSSSDSSSSSSEDNESLLLINQNKYINKINKKWNLWSKD